jgi:hypothetical protein
MARLDKHFSPDEVLPRLYNLFLKEIGITDETTAGIEAAAKAFSNGPKETPRSVLLVRLISEFRLYRRMQHLIGIQEVILSQNKRTARHLQHAAQSSNTAAKCWENLLVELPPDDPCMPLARQAVETARAEAESYQSDCKRFLESGQKTRSTILGSPTDRPRGAATLRATLRAELRAKTIRLLYKAGYENEEIAQTMYSDYSSDPDAATERVATYITRAVLPRERVRTPHRHKKPRF